MTVRFKKKVRGYRGKRYHGWGGKKKHRGKGSKGGKGWGGSHKGKKTYIYTYAKGHFGYKGFRQPGAEKDVIINIGMVDIIARKEGKKELDLGAMGYTKLLSAGKLSSPLALKVFKASASAKAKVEAAGGKLEADVITGGEAAEEVKEASGGKEKEE
jgi:large subunit ribosomal protein L15